MSFLYSFSDYLSELFTFLFRQFHVVYAYPFAIRIPKESLQSPRSDGSKGNVPVGKPFQLYPSWFDENGEEYPDGMNYGFRFNMDEWPNVRMDGMIAADNIPERIWMQLVDDNAKPEDEPAPKIELNRINP